MSIYLICIYVLLSLFLATTIVFFIILYVKRKNNDKKLIDNLTQKKASLYIKYDKETENVIINNYTYLNLNISKSLMNVCKGEKFIESIKHINEIDSSKFEISTNKDNIVYDFVFTYKEEIENNIILKCDYSIDRVKESCELKTIDDIRAIHDGENKKSAALYYLNIKDFNTINQRYGQRCGDYVLETIKERLLKVENKKTFCSYFGSDQFIIYYNKAVSKKKALKHIQSINKKLCKAIDVGCININVVFGIGVCVGKYEDLDEFVKCSYIAADYAKKRKKYNIVIYNKEMKLEENTMSLCEKEIENIIKGEDVTINYTPVFNNLKGKFLGYISTPVFNSNLVDYDKIINVAIQKDRIETLMYTLIDSQLMSFIKKRPLKSSKLFINLQLEDLTTFLEVYLSNHSYSECKIVILLNVKRGYEMINKFSNISSSINKIVDEGIEIAVDINYSNMYDYDYILKNATYLVVDESIISNMNNALSKNKVINIVELANRYELELLASGVKEYIQYENLTKYGVKFFAGSYFGKGGKKPNEIEQTRTKIFAKFLKDSKKNKNN